MKTCEVCQSEFKPTCNSAGRFCSVLCFHESRKSLPRKKVCKGCELPFYVKPGNKNVFCTRSCAASFNNLRREGRRRDAGMAPVCVVCNGPFEYGNRGNRKYCSDSCYRKNHSEAAERKRVTKIDGWLAGEDWSYSNGRLPLPIREYLLTESGGKCSQCGWAEVNAVLGKPILTINHIDGNWKNNKRSNLEVLCYNCHTLTPTFGSLNRGSVSGRRPRMNDRECGTIEESLTE